MTNVTSASPAAGSAFGSKLLSRILQEGYGTGAWHGPDLAAAIADVSATTAFQRPKKGRHNIAEVVLHHAYFVRSVTGQLTGQTPDPFPVAGEDWFELDAGNGLSWKKVTATLDGLQNKLTQVVRDIEGGRMASPLSEEERLGLVLGITCHAVYHAGQIQLVRRMLGS